MTEYVIPIGGSSLPHVKPTSTELHEYVLLSDDDGHWYVVRSDQEDAFHEAVQMINDDVADGFGDLDIHEVGGAPSLVKFTDWRID